MEGTLGQVARCPRAGRQLDRAGRQADQYPVPEPAAGGRVRVEAGDHEAPGRLGEPGPGQVRAHVPAADAVVGEPRLQRLPVGEVVAAQLEAGLGRQDVVRIRCGATLQRHGSILLVVGHPRRYDDRGALGPVVPLRRRAASLALLPGRPVAGSGDGRGLVAVEAGHIDRTTNLDQARDGSTRRWAAKLQDRTRRPSWVSHVGCMLCGWSRRASSGLPRLPGRSQRAPGRQAWSCPRSGPRRSAPTRDLPGAVRGRASPAARRDLSAGGPAAGSDR